MNCRGRNSIRGHATACFWLLLFLSLACTATATFDAVPLIRKPAQQLTSTDLSETLGNLIDILVQHNRRFESAALAQYVEQLRAVLQPDCCDYFTAVVLSKGITEALSDVLELRLQASLRPVVRRSYVAAVWLLQRSKHFSWSTTRLQHTTLPGLLKLYEAYTDAAAGKPIRFHHISKAGGTSLCTAAWENRCRGPGMGKKDNCLLDLGTDRPVWVLRHNVSVANAVASIPEPPPPSPAAADDPEEAERLQTLAMIRQQRMAARVFDWWMYDCPADRLVGQVGRPCNDVQEQVVSKSATFHASENTLPTRHGAPQVCEAFTNVVIVREALSQATSLMAEVSIVYTRLVKQSRVIGWTPPRWNLDWWQQWAPLVVNSYATRTLLGAAGYCPAAGPAEMAQAGSAVASAVGAGAAAGPGELVRQVLNTRDPRSSSSSDDSSAGWLLSDADVQHAQRVLASFDVVLDLGNSQLMDASLSKLLGWSGQSYSKGKHQRTRQAVTAHSWQTLELLARQLSPPLNDSLLLPTKAAVNSSSAGSKGSGQRVSSQQQSAPPAIGSRAEKAPNKQQEQQLSHAPWRAVGASGNKPPSALNDTSVDILRRLIGEARVRSLYSSYGFKGALLPIMAEVPLLQPPASLVTAAINALKAAFTAPMTVANETTDGNGWHLAVTLHLEQQGPAGGSSIAAAGAAAQAGAVPAAQGAEGPGASPAKQLQTLAAAPGSGGAAPAGAEGQQSATYHVWPTHQVVLTDVQYRQLLRATAADMALYRTARVLQLLDAAWVSVTGQQRRVRKMLRQMQEESAGVCGFAGLNHLQ